MAKSFLRGAQIFQTVSNSLQLCPTKFSMEGEKFCREVSPGYGPDSDFWTEKIIYIYNQGLIFGEAKKTVISGLPFETFALFW